MGEISKKVQESRLKWYGHVLRREDEYVGKRVMAMEVPGKRRRGRPKRRWLDSIRNDLSESPGTTRKPGEMEASYKKHRPHIKVGKYEDEEDSIDDWRPMVCHRGLFSKSITRPREGESLSLDLPVS